MNSALSAKFRDGEITVIDNMNIEEPKTKLLRNILDKIGLNGSVLIVIPDKDEKVELAARNIPRVDVSRVKELNVYSVLSHERLLISKDAIEKMREAFLG